MKKRRRGISESDPAAAHARTRAARCLYGVCGFWWGDEISKKKKEVKRKKNC